MTPAYELTVDGTPVTSNFMPFLLSLEVTDHAGSQADEVRVMLDDSKGTIG